MLSDVNFILGEGGLGLTAPSEDGVSALIASGMAVSGGLQLNTPYLLTDIESLEALGVNKAYDLNNRTLVWHQADEYFRKFREEQSSGELYLIVLDQASATFDSLTSNDPDGPAHTLQSYANGRIRNIGVCYVPPTAVTTPETRPSATIVIQNNGDVNELIIATTEDGVHLGAYQIQSGDGGSQKTTGIKNAINNLSSVHGWTAESASSTLFLTGPVGSGSSLNASTVTISYGGEVDEVAAQADVPVSTFSGMAAGDTVEAVFLNGDDNPSIGAYTVQSGDTGALILAGLNADITAEALFPGTRTASPTNLNFTAPAGAGAEYNTFKIRINKVISSSSSFSLHSFTGGVSAGPFANTTGTVTGGVDMVEQDLPVPNFAQGIDADVLTAVARMQAVADSMRVDRKAPIVVVIEGRYLAPLVSIGALANAKLLGSPNVAIVIAQDRAIANLRKAFAKYASVGTALGCLAYGRVNHPISWVERNNLESVSEGRFVAPALSNGVLMKDVSIGTQQSINTKGYIFARTFPSQTGCYFSDSCTATLATSDYSSLENNAVINKVIRRADAALTPKLNAPQQVDQTTGRLLPSVVVYYESLCEKACADMLTAEEISGIKFTIDPNQNYLSTNRLQVRARIVPTGKNKAIDVDLAFSNPLVS